MSGFPFSSSTRYNKIVFIKVIYKGFTFGQKALIKVLSL